MTTPSRWLFSTIGRRGYAAQYFKAADPTVHIVGTGNTPHAPGFKECESSCSSTERSNGRSA